MDFDGGSLIASLIVSSIGFVVFGYGKRLERLPQVIIGLVMMAFPYFVPDTLLMSIIAGVLLVGLWVAVRFGL
jgi:hypothetical protein